MTTAILVTQPTKFPVPIENPKELEAAALAVARLNAEPHVMFHWTGNQAVEEVADDRISKLADLLALISQMDNDAIDTLRAIAEAVWFQHQHRYGRCPEPFSAWPGLTCWSETLRRATLR